MVGWRKTFEAAPLAARTALLAALNTRHTFIMKPPDWCLECDTATFERIKSEESFQQILALARAVNGLQFVISALVKDAQDFSPTASRSRINSFLVWLRNSLRGFIARREDEPAVRAQ